MAGGKWWINKPQKLYLNFTNDNHKNNKWFSNCHLPYHTLFDVGLRSIQRITKKYFNLSRKLVSQFHSSSVWQKLPFTTPLPFPSLRHADDSPLELHLSTVNSYSALPATLIIKVSFTNFSKTLKITKLR